MPKEEPLQRLAAFQFVFEPECVVFIGEFQEVEELGASFHDGEGWGLGVVDQDGDTAVGVDAEVPILLLLVGPELSVLRSVSVWGDVGGEKGGGEHFGGRPLGAVDVCKLFEHDLDLLAVRGVKG